MENYRLLIENGLTIIEQMQYSFRVSVQKNRKLTPDDKGAILEATHYKEDGVFINNGSYIFEVLSKENQPIYDEVDLTLFHAAIDFFFKSILDTEYFVKSIPQPSSIYKGDKKLVWA